MKNTVRKGNITETKTILKFLELGYNVFTPFGDGSKTDLIVELNGKLFKIQCKTSRVEKNREVFNGYSTSRTRSSSEKGKKVRYTKEHVDFFCTFDIDDNFYMIPIEDINTGIVGLTNYTHYILRAV